MDYKNTTRLIFSAAVGSCLWTSASLPAATVAHPVTSAWLVGKWGPAQSGSASGNVCETDDDVTFERSGTYSDGESHGRYRVDGVHVIYFDRVLVDMSDDTEDRSDFHKPLVTRVTWVSRNRFRENGTVYVRCSGSVAA